MTCPTPRSARAAFEILRPIARACVSPACQLPVTARNRKTPAIAKEARDRKAHQWSCGDRQALFPPGSVGDADCTPLVYVENSAKSIIYNAAVISQTSEAELNAMSSGKVDYTKAHDKAPRPMRWTSCRCWAARMRWTPMRRARR